MLMVVSRDVSVEFEVEVGSARADPARRHRRYMLDSFMLLSLLLAVGCGTWDFGGDLE